MPSFEAGAQLLSSLSGYAYTKRAWRKEVFELFMDPLFFTMDASCASKLVFVRWAEIDLDPTLLQVHSYGTFKSAHAHKELIKDTLECLIGGTVA